jgi:hypothetical protein
MKANASQWAQLLVVYGALMGLLALTAGASFLPGGWWSTPVALAIATAKAFLIFYRPRYFPCPPSTGHLEVGVITTDFEVGRIALLGHAADRDQGVRLGK